MSSNTIPKLLIKLFDTHDAKVNVDGQPEALDSSLTYLLPQYLVLSKIPYSISHFSTPINH